MTDADLLAAVESSLIGLDAFHRDLYAIARLRVQRGESLKATQRQQLARVVRLAMQARMTFTSREEVPHAHP